MAGDPLAWHSTKVKDGLRWTDMIHARAHVRAPFPYLGNSWKWTDYSETWCVVRGPLAMHFTQDGGFLHERTCSTHI